MRCSDKHIDYQHPSQLTANLSTTITLPDTNFTLSLGAYKAYSPCRLTLHDPIFMNVTDGSYDVSSSAFFISDTDNSPGVTWSVDNKAPVAAGATTSGAATVVPPIEGGVWIIGLCMGSLAAIMLLL